MSDNSKPKDKTLEVEVDDASLEDISGGTSAGDKSGGKGGRAG